MSVEIGYETHATSVDNERGLATGWLPGTLSERGREQARALGRRRREVDVVLVSDLARAVETAAIAFSGRDVPMFQDVRLRECNYGRLNGMRVSRLASERGAHIMEPWPGGQSYLDVVTDMKSLLADLPKNWDGARVCLIGHSANRWALDHLLLGEALEDLVDRPFGWQEGWHYSLPSNWTAGVRHESV